MKETTTEVGCLMRATLQFNVAVACVVLACGLLSASSPAALAQGTRHQGFLVNALETYSRMLRQAGRAAEADKLQARIKTLQREER